MSEMGIFRQPLAQCAAYQPSPKVGVGSVYPTALFRIPEIKFR